MFELSLMIGIKAAPVVEPYLRLTLARQHGQCLVMDWAVPSNGRGCNLVGQEVSAGGGSWRRDGGRCKQVEVSLNGRHNLWIKDTGSGCTAKSTLLSAVSPGGRSLPKG